MADDNVEKTDKPEKSKKVADAPYQGSLSQALAYKPIYYDPKIGGKLYDSDIAVFRIAVPEKPVPIKFTPSSQFKSKVLEKLDGEAKNILTALDYYYFKDTDFYAAAQDKRLDFYYKLKHEVAEKLKHPVTNAYLKMRELAIHFDMLDGVNKVFCNAELPGNFILAIRDLRPDMEVIASSYMPDDWSDNPKNILEDKYDLMKNNPDMWLIKPGRAADFNGDVTKPENLDYIIKHVGRESVDMYTSDIGIKVASEDYHRGEEVRFPLYIGAVIHGIATLKKGGKILLKEFTYSNSYGLASLAFLGTLFDEYYITKPITSRKYNHEIYVYGTGFRGISDAELAQLRAYQAKIRDGDRSETIIDLNAAPAPLLDGLINARRILSQRNIAYHEELLHLFNTHSIRIPEGLHNHIMQDWTSKYLSDTKSS